MSVPSPAPTSASVVHVASVMLDGVQHCARCAAMLAAAVCPQDGYAPGASVRECVIDGRVRCTPHAGPAAGERSCPDTRAVQMPAPALPGL